MIHMKLSCIELFQRIFGIAFDVRLNMLRSGERRSLFYKTKTEELCKNDY